MTSKEPIIIDGVNVRNCKGIDLSLSPLVKCKFLKFKTSDGGIAGIWCSDHTNCYCKQLQRKTAECEELISEKDFYLQKIAVLEQECEELKEQLQANQPTGICETCMAKAILQNDKYRKALKEIGKIVKINCEEICGRKFEDCNDFLCSSKNILDIINKAKGERNAV